MAKLKIEQENTVDTPTGEVAQVVPSKEEQSPKEPVKEKGTPVKEPKKSTTEKTEIPEHVTRVLKAFSTYPELYIDVHGGAFAPDSSANVRGNATLYKNPYFKS